MDTGTKLSRKRDVDPSLHMELHPAKGEAKAAVLIIHGYAEHSGRYGHVIDAWTELGLMVGRYDLRGHGRSEGPRGHITSFEDYVADTFEVLDKLEEDSTWRKLKKPILFGHSQGGLIAAHVALADQARFRAIATTSPFFGLALPVAGIKRLAGIIFSLLYPRLALPTGLEGAHVTQDAEMAAAYDNDPLRVTKATARWFTEAQRAQESALRRAPSLRLPLACFQAGDDKVVDAKATRAFFDTASSEDKSFVDVEGQYHEVMNDTRREQTIVDIAERLLTWG